MRSQNQSTPTFVEADSTCPPLPPDLSPLIARLKQQTADWPSYGLPFAAALDQAMRHIERGATLTRVSFTAYHVRALPHAQPYRVTLGGCSCGQSWCYHRALVHLVAVLPQGGA